MSLARRGFPAIPSIGFVIGITALILAFKWALLPETKLVTICGKPPNSRTIVTSDATVFETKDQTVYDSLVPQQAFFVTYKTPLFSGGSQTWKITGAVPSKTKPAKCPT
jgi:hypothetical protein